MHNRMNYKKIMASLCVVLMVAACAKPQTARPHLEQSAIAQEASVQRSIAQAGQQVPVQGSVNYANMEARLQAHGQRVKAAGMQLCQAIARDPRSCAYQFSIDNQDVLNAYADGENIFVTPVMMQFAAKDDTLGMVLSHEYAHNIMGHVASKKTNATAGLLVGSALDMLAGTQGVNTDGKLAGFGAEQGANAYSPAFESEADYVGLYIMYYAGYDIRNAAGLWRDMTAADGSESAFMTTTHPANPERYVLLNQTKDEIFAKRDAHQPVVPNMKKKK